MLLLFLGLGSSILRGLNRYMAKYIYPILVLCGLEYYYVTMFVGYCSLLIYLPLDPLFFPFHLVPIVSTFSDITR